MNLIGSPVLKFDNSYGRLGDAFSRYVAPTPVAQPRIVKLNRSLAAELDLDADAFDAETWAEILSGNRMLPGTASLAMAYAGHQFGNFVPQLGDGRAILLGEIIDRSGVRRDIQLKGAGRTPFSRGGDGRAALGPMLREYLVSEAMHALGVPTTRALAVVTTGEPVYRETVLPGAILTRVASGHVRVGTFQYFAARQDDAAVRQLADYVIARHYPNIDTSSNRYLALLAEIADRQASLVSQWLLVGFIHGVMNTDNVSLSGETIDYGPCAFMDEYDPATVFSSIDAMGRYAYGNQAKIARWNLARFAECLLPLIDADSEKAVAAATEVVEDFPTRLREYWLGGMRRKLGLSTAQPNDEGLIDALLDIMRQNGADFTLTFRRLCAAARGPDGDAEVRSLFSDPVAYDHWATQWRARLNEAGRAPDLVGQSMVRANPSVIPRNHCVERALSAAERNGDFAPFEALVAALATPYEEPETARELMYPPKPDERVQQTFCGT
jgi:serine/tyrosine/threonine adenylyltransferase